MIGSHNGYSIAAEPGLLGLSEGFFGSLEMHFRDALNLLLVRVSVIKCEVKWCEFTG